MQNYQYLKGYQDNDELIKSYFEFTQRIFNFDLEKWRNQGHWNENYIPHSLVSNNEVFANISASIMKLQINRKDITAIQLGSVGVLPQYRGKGFLRILMEKVLEEYKEFPLVFLFAGDDVSEFYQKFGFRRVEEKLPLINITNAVKEAEAEKIHINSPHINRLLRRKLQRSSIIDARENHSIYWFHLLYNFSENIYYIREKDVVFIAAYKDSAVYVYDILSENEITFEEIKDYIITDKTREVKFYFTPDWLSVKYDVIPRTGDALYVQGEFFRNMNNSKFPETSIT